MYQLINHVKIVRISLDQTKRYCGSKSQSTYYDILGIPKDASKKDIREAFIKLSKKIHPDKSSEASSKSHSDFIKVNEAYNVLSKDYSRQQYDLNLKYQSFRPPSYRTYNSQSYDGFTRPNVFYRDEMFYRDIKRARERHQRYQRQNPGSNMYFSPTKIVIYCFLLSMIGSIVQLWAIMKSPVFNREALNWRSERNFSQYRRVREQVTAKNNSKVLDDLLNLETEFDTDNDDHNNDDNSDTDRNGVNEVKW